MLHRDVSKGFLVPCIGRMNETIHLVEYEEYCPLRLSVLSLNLLLCLELGSDGIHKLIAIDYPLECHCKYVAGVDEQLSFPNSSPSMRLQGRTLSGENSPSKTLLCHMMRSITPLLFLTIPFYIIPFAAPALSPAGKPGGLNQRSTARDERNIISVQRARSESASTAAKLKM